MKKMYSLLVVGLLAASTVMAQQLPTTLKPHASKAVTCNSKTSINTNGDRTTGFGYVDYSWLAVNDLSYVWRFNSLYTGTDTACAYAGVAIFPFIGFLDYSDNIDDWNYASYPATLSYTIDTIFTVITHENNSGSNDLIVMQVANLTASNTLTATSAVQWSDTLITNATLSPGGNWVGSGAAFNHNVVCGYTTAPGQKVGLVLRYYDPTKLDTLAVLGSCIDDGSGGTMTQALYPTSFMSYPPFIPSVSTNRTIGYGSPVGSAGWFEAQDWEIWAHVTWNDASGISDQDMNATLYQNMPNPANGTTIIKYDLAKATSVSVVFYDLAGKKVKEINEGEMSPGSYQLEVDLSDMAKGSYFYALKTTEGVSLTKKMVITK